MGKTDWRASIQKLQSLQLEKFQTAKGERHLMHKNCELSREVLFDMELRDDAVAGTSSWCLRSEVDFGLARNSLRSSENFASGIVEWIGSEGVKFPLYLEYIAATELLRTTCVAFIDSATAQQGD